MELGKPRINNVHSMNKNKYLYKMLQIIFDIDFADLENCIEIKLVVCLGYSKCK